MAGKRVPHKSELDRWYGEGWELDEYLVSPVCLKDEALVAPVAGETHRPPKAPVSFGTGAFSLSVADEGQLDLFDDTEQLQLPMVISERSVGLVARCCA